MGDYKYRVGLFKNAVRNFTGVIGEDSIRGAAEVDRLRRECHDVDDRLAHNVVFTCGVVCIFTVAFRGRDLVLVLANRFVQLFSEV